jgi:hypothetical protein
MTHVTYTLTCSISKGYVTDYGSLEYEINKYNAIHYNTIQYTFKINLDPNRECAKFGSSHQLQTV